VIHKDVKVREIKAGTSLTLFFSLRGGGGGGMPAKGGKKRPETPQNELLSYMSMYHRMTRQQQAEELKEQDRRTGEAMGAGTAKRMLEAQQAAAVRKLVPRQRTVCCAGSSMLRPGS
jgi:hypothetical protein